MQLGDIITDNPNAATGFAFTASRGSKVDALQSTPGNMAIQFLHPIGPLFSRDSHRTRTPLNCAGVTEIGMTVASQRLLQILWNEHRNSDVVFQALIQLLNHPNEPLAATAKTVLVQLCFRDPRPMITEAIKQGLTPAHRAKIIAIIGEIEQPLEMMGAATLVNHRRLQSKQAVEAVVQLFDRLPAGRGMGAHIGGQIRYRLMKVQRPRSKGRVAG